MTTDRQTYERGVRARGYSRIAGVDEVGRAAWAGPMVAAAVILDEDFDPNHIRSSKKMSPTSRMREYDRIMSEADSVGVHQVSAKDIDTKGIDVCHMELLRDAVRALEVEPDYVLVDYYTVPRLQQPQEAITNGDDLSVSVAAASIVAKVTLDRIMEDFATQYKEYGFAVNKGYGSKEHIHALEARGPSPIHRLSVSPVRQRLRPAGS